MTDIGKGNTGRMIHCMDDRVLEFLIITMEDYRMVGNFRHALVFQHSHTSPKKTPPIHNQASSFPMQNWVSLLTSYLLSSHAEPNTQDYKFSSEATGAQLYKT